MTLVHHRQHSGGEHSSDLRVVHDAEDVRHLVHDLFDPLREHPTVVVSPSGAGTPLIDPHRLCRLVSPTAEVVLVDNPRICYTLSDELPEPLLVYGGALRVFHPGTGHRDAFTDHPLIRTDRLGPEGAIAKAARALGVPLPDDSPHADSTEADLASRLADEQTAHARTITELNALREQFATVSGERDAARSQARNLDQQLRQLRTEIEQYRRVYTDPEQQFRHEAWLTWLHTSTEDDRSRWPLREYHLGHEFLASLQAQELVDRERIMRACVDVITGRAPERDGRQVHRLRTHSSGAAPAHIRADGAMAWRCAIQRNTPAAARLTWWEKNNIVELSQVAPHDDYQPR
ncbi:hypothetical protein [Haloactinomyces albus]|uniref:Uncharacterized protein n=1 Tax=Haloactinomyces albus TaxID=1352928 RepID=A0AAE3ZA03_9ACTN|nr:hypothetical protein [Haloactinomyces albus]MDR7300075.1 hypothetical protein [Haloactinomyces albus]